MTDRYVDPATGSDAAAGTSGAPWKTIAKVNATAVGGDSVFFRRAGAQYPWREALTTVSNILYGAYGEQVTLPSKALAPNPPAALRTVNCTTKAQLDSALAAAIPGDHIVCSAFTASYTTNPVISASGTEANPIVVWGAGTPSHWGSPTTVLSNNNNNVYSITGAYIQFRNIQWTNWFYGPFPDGCNNVVFDSCEFALTSQQCLHPRNNAHHVWIQRCHIHDTGQISNQFAEGIYVGTGGADATNNIYALRNWFHDCTAESLESADGISNCWYEGNYIDGLNTLYQPGLMPALVGIQGDNHTYVRNILRYGAPHGFYVQGGAGTTGIVFRANRVALFDQHAFGDSHAFHRVSGTVSFAGDDNVVTNIAAGGEAYFSITPSTAYGSDTGVTPRPQILGSEQAFYWTKDAQANTWYTTEFGTAPAVVRFDRALGTSVGSKAGVDAAGKWFWESGTGRLYVFSRYYPTIEYPTYGVEGSQRASAVSIGVNNVTLQSLDLWTGGTATLSIGGGLTGTSIADTLVDGEPYTVALPPPPVLGPTPPKRHRRRKISRYFGH